MFFKDCLFCFNFELYNKHTEPNLFFSNGLRTADEISYHNCKNK